MNTQAILLIWFTFGLWQGVVDENSPAYMVGRVAGMLFILLVIVVVIFTLIKKSKK